MGYKGDSVMDCGYYMGGHPGGMMYFPPVLPGGTPQPPVIIPWHFMLPDDDPQPNQVEIKDAE